MKQVRRLSPAEADRLRDEPFTYDEVGRSAAPYPSGFPEGYRHVRHTEIIGHGQSAFDDACRKLTTWRMHTGSGLSVAVSSPTAEPGAVVVARLGPGPLSLRIPCRVVSVVDEPDRCGFAYGTLPGHPETGEESFLIMREEDQVRLTVTGFSRPGTRLARLGGPISRWMQNRALRRYAAVLRR